MKKKPFEKYLELKELCEGKEYNEGSLKQYLHIAQVMEEEERSYNRHRTKMLQWLGTIEKVIRDSVKNDLTNQD